MEESQTATWDLELSQEMERPSKKQRRGSYKKYGAARKNYKSSVPMAIRTRGTPSGYYELPVRVLFKLYCNTSSGLWNTNQSDASPIGLTGYNGFGISSTLDSVRISLGNGTISANVDQAVPGFAELQNVFDLCKITEQEIQYWWTVDPREMPTGSHGYFDMYAVEDPNNVDPPANVNTVLQYSKVTRIPSSGQGIVKQRYKPHIRAVAGSENYETGTSTTVGISQPSTYLQTSKPGVAHFGVRGYCDIPTNATTCVAYLNILVVQKRRYKIGK